MHICFERLVHDQHSLLIFDCRLYKEERNDGSKSSVKWTCPNIHDLTTILEKVEVDKILDNVCDKRLSDVSQLPVVQLRDECAKLNLSKIGRKVILMFMLGKDFDMEV